MKKIFLINFIMISFYSFLIAQNSITENMILIPQGSFLMGSPTSEDWREKDETQHSVSIKSFYLNKFEVTQAEYKSIMGNNPSQSFIANDNPVDSVNWYDAIIFCNKLSQKEKLTPCYVINGDEVTWNKNANGYRLPTEAEWEYACRATTTTPFNTQNSISSQESNYYGYYPYMIEDNYFNTEKLEAKPGTYRQRTVSVNSFKPNSWGLYNMHGNVSEWCWDFYGEYQTDKKFSSDPSGTTEGFLRVCRGGGWNDFAKHLRSAFRSAQTPDDIFINRGFRLARNQ